MKLVCLGDSLTYGYGVPRKDCWVSLTAVRTGRGLLNRGLNGDTTGGMLARFGRDVLEQAPCRVLLMGGANDIILSHTDAQARANLAALVFQALDRRIKPLLGFYPPLRPEEVGPPWSELGDFFALEQVFADYRMWLLDFAQSLKIETVDFSQGFDRPGLLLDGLHPNREGHRLMADALCKVLPPAPV